MATPYDPAKLKKLVDPTGGSQGSKVIDEIYDTVMSIKEFMTVQKQREQMERARKLTEAREQEDENKEEDLNEFRELLKEDVEEVMTDFFDDKSNSDKLFSNPKFKETIKKENNKTLESIKGGFDTMVAAPLAAMGTAITNIGKSLFDVKTMFSDFDTYLDNAVHNIIQGVWGVIKTGFSMIFQAAKFIVYDLPVFILKQIGSMLWGFVSTVAGFVFTAVANLSLSILSQLALLVPPIMSILGMVTTMLPVILAVGGLMALAAYVLWSIWGNPGEFFQKIWDNVSGFFGGIAETIEGWWGKISGWWGDLTKWWGEFLNYLPGKEWWDSAINTFKSIIDFFGGDGTGEAVFNWLDKNVFNAEWMNSLLEGLDKVFVSFFGKSMEDIWKEVKDWMVKLGNIINNIDTIVRAIYPVVVQIGKTTKGWVDWAKEKAEQSVMGYMGAADMLLGTDSLGFKSEERQRIERENFRIEQEENFYKDLRTFVGGVYDVLEEDYASKYGNNFRKSDFKKDFPWISELYDDGLRGFANSDNRYSGLNMDFADLMVALRNIFATGTDGKSIDPTKYPRLFQYVYGKSGMNPLEAADIANQKQFLIETIGPTAGIAAFAQGGVVLDQTLSLIAEAGYPEVVIPLNEQGKSFMSDVVQDMDAFQLIHLTQESNKAKLEGIEKIELPKVESKIENIQANQETIYSFLKELEKDSSNTESMVDLIAAIDTRFAGMKDEVIKTIVAAIMESNKEEKPDFNVPEKRGVASTSISKGEMATVSELIARGILDNRG